MHKLSKTEQMGLRADAKKELEKLEAFFNDKSKTETINEYKNYFNICESTYKVILEKHQLMKHGKINGHLRLDMRQVPQAMAYAGYSVDKNLLKRLFGSEDRVGIRSAKVLRDFVTHGMDEKAVEEIIRRKDDLYRDMNSFIEIIRKG